MNKYDDIINIPHYDPIKHKRMSIYNRSAQFAPFSALTGYNEAVIETARLTSKKIEIDEGLKNILNNKLNIIEENLSHKWNVTITYFIPDKKKDGGKYISVTGIVKKIDLYNQLIIMFDKTKIPINDIIDVTCEEIGGR